MTDPLIFQLLLLLVLILISGFFSLAEIALIALNKNKLEKKAVSGPRKKDIRQAKRILSITGEPSKFIATIQIGSILAGFLASAFAANNISVRLSASLLSLGLPLHQGTIANISMVLITIILSFIQMVLGELVPKRIALKKADVIAYAISGIILSCSRLFAPLVWLLAKTTNAILRLIRIGPEATPDEITEEEIRLMIDLGSSRGTIKDGEKEILHNVFEFDNKTAAEVMTHRKDTVLLGMDESEKEWEQKIIDNKHSFFPVCGKDSDDIIGVLNTRDYFCLSERNRENVMTQAVTPAQLIPTSVRTDMLLRKMKKSRNHFAVVLDEHGGMMGVITVKDLLEELVGKLDDDLSHPPEQPLIERISVNTWRLNGAISLDRAARELELPLPVERYDTFSGFVFSLLGRIPEDGEKPELQEQGLKINILEIRERRLEKALVTKIENME
ncbi:MAG: hemolysin family protein [Treponema sp.]|nr:hemolysin family protein [Treponema sp.]